MIKIVPDALLALAKSEKAIHRLMGRLNNGAVPEQPLLDLSIRGAAHLRGETTVPEAS